MELHQKRAFKSLRIPSSFTHTTFFSLRSSAKSHTFNQVFYVRYRLCEIVKREEVSISKAAELAGLNIEEMKRVLADQGVEIKRGFTKNRKTAASELSEMMR